MHELDYGKAAISALTSHTTTPMHTAIISTVAAVGKFFLFIAGIHDEDVSNRQCKAV